MTLYPMGYARQMVTLSALEAVHGPKMHPEYQRRIFPWLESMGGLIGIGGGWRAGGQQPDRPGFAPEGKSFHQDQRFASGFVGYCAVDLVARNGTSIHRAPTWAESTTAPQYGLHTFITGEPWHLQPVEIRGWQTWVNAGRPDPVAGFPLPSDRPDIPQQEDDMAQINAIILRIRDKDGQLYDDQVFGLTLANPAHVHKLAAADDRVIVATLDATRSEIETELGFGLTPA